MNVWCLLVHERVISQYFFDEDIIKSNSFLDMMESYVLPQLKNKNNNLILQLDGVHVHSAHIVHDCFNMNFPS
jgi:hypothetical protein